MCPPNVNRLFAKSAAKLRDIRDGNVIQSPERILVERSWALLQSNINAIREQIILSK